MPRKRNEGGGEGKNLEGGEQADRRTAAREIARHPGRSSPRVNAARGDESEALLSGSGLTRRHGGSRTSRRSGRPWARGAWQSAGRGPSSVTQQFFLLIAKADREGKEDK
ncbi:hypothetical protein HPB50_005524 [Hyalomma asiaticum]|uniref:Uncharacterized protein n=1 Tax=Hyalomma asiaticum TaxID=266040 RepID=A0ACB7THJ4_HYAAI|nr:hypothetical protein HPB50_005524 [Hyalomma asiaticum]